MDNSINHSMEERFVDRLLHALANLGNYEPDSQQQQPETNCLQSETAASLPNH